MADFSILLQQGNAWLFLPSAIVLGALHGLEPGHSKTMMAAFIVAIRGTMTQAVLLGLSATLSHTAVVWAVAMAGLYFGRNWDAQASEPYFQIVSGVLIIGVAAWMLWRTWRNQRLADSHDHHHGHSHHGHDHEHSHDHEHAHSADHQHGRSQDAGKPASSAAALGEWEATAPAYQDPHEKAHADDIRRRFANREVTTGQVILFGLTGGLIPCPASITVLLLCLHLKKVALGATLVLGFSIGLALTLVASGALAALSLRHAARRWSGFGEFARKAPYFSGIVITLVGVYVIYQGATALA
ncbi:MULTISPECIES: nickel/cobalt efflux protein RcnA [unclassified Achromobacter]|uniref:nickel/cobalt efflux protein RcnA n=1 Tax=unclassified Achromobacter TaxID=2626865 RepID=UPI000B51A271|nr:MULTISPECIES: nickel/cobalt efflux protein RcnA [unclassified Achromobacter]OWT75361.1 nickel/cobalt efflux protein RcnA [Achromobacter sp. HZ28]OWT76021.1 nickel/cobalt efflux protein RcnA [Achromobacter sp. HZ34]